MSTTLHLLDPSETIGQMNECFFPPYITLAHLFNAPRGWEIKPRTLTQFQLQYVVEGTAEYTIEENKFTTNRGDLVYHAPNERHSVKTIEDNPYLCISVVFHFGDSHFPIDYVIGQRHYLGNFAEHPPFESKLSRLIAHYQQPGLQNQIICQGLLLQILHGLHKWNQDQSQTKVQEKTKTKMALVRNYISNHYNKNIQLKHLEEVSGLSRNYVIFQFRKTYGMTPFEYMTSVRIEKAKEMAIHSNLSISDIARIVGYSDVHTFGRMFKNKTGTNLSQFCSTLVIK